MNREVEPTKKRFPCSYCEYSSDYKQHLIRHERIHNGDKPYKCNYCAKTFAKGTTLVDHERIHTGEKPFQCKYCDKSFAQRSALLRHERIHTGEKPFKCKHCNKSFKDRSTQVRHERIHTGEKPVKCTYCCKSFSNKYNLVQHERIHRGEKPYSCNHCNRSFTQNSSLTRHKKKCSKFVIKEEPSTENDILNEDYSKFPATSRSFTQKVLEINHSNEGQKKHIQTEIVTEVNKTDLQDNVYVEINSSENIAQNPLNVETGDISPFVECQETVKEEIKEESFVGEESNDPLSCNASEHQQFFILFMDKDSSHV